MKRRRDAILCGSIFAVLFVLAPACYAVYLFADLSPQQLRAAGVGAVGMIGVAVVLLVGHMIGRESHG